jgi:hypothetical protein
MIKRLLNFLQHGFPDLVKFTEKGLGTMAAIWPSTEGLTLNTCFMKFHQKLGIVYRPISLYCKPVKCSEN